MQPQDQITSPQPAQQPIPPQQPLPPQPAPVEEKKSRFPKAVKIILIGLALFIVFIVIAIFVATSATKAPQKISDQFVNDVQSSNTSAAYALTSKGFQEATTEEQLDTLVKRVGPVLQGEEKVSGRAIEKSTGSPQTAVLVYEVKTSDGTKYMKVELQKDGNTWQVVNFRSSDTPLEAKVE